MLWYAKMRFGKTLSALQVAKEMNFSRTLILTHRPVVDEGWFEDFHKIFYDTEGWDYGSKKNGASFDNLEKRRKKHGLHYVFFASIQDLRGSELVGGKFDKNDEIFSAPWDFIIIDEAHEGTQTQLGQAVITELVKPSTKVLQLSGTAFNLLSDHEDEEVYTWDYTMEQRAKMEWDRNHFGDPNPYAGLPRMNIYTYDLGRLMQEFADEDIAFNFREFFRTDDNGDFVHGNDVQHFLNLLTKEDPQSMYPFANRKYRSIFRHTLWMLPGVKEAKALSAMLRNHPVFGNFEIVNVAGDGDEEEAHEEALKKVNDAIKSHPVGTITLSCGRLTTGVSVPQWMGVLMLSGSFNTAASSYMQTIFRVQTPYSVNGLVKEDCYVFDFAPDRTLKVLATVPRVSTKAGKTTEQQKRALAEFINFCPVIGMEGSRMVAYDANRMMEQLKKAYVERVVRNGFEDGYLYNDELLKLDGVELEQFAKLKKIIGTTKAMAKSGDIDVNSQGLTEEQYAEKEKLEKKPKKQRTPEEEARLEELKEKKKLRDTAVSILRGISIRMPLLIYGAEITDEDEQLTIDNFTQLIDDKSWEEFMPKGVTKEVFNSFKKYYDDDIFAAAGKRIRSMARAADRLTIEERIERITDIFSTFRNPDKETVLTPWRVVNMHMGDCLGGYCFFNEDYTEQLSEPRYIDRHRVTDDVFTPGSYLMEINSKSGLYPLYLAYNLYRRALKDETHSPQTLEDHQRIWDRVVRESIFVICKTPMAKAITRRTLMGFRESKVNTRFFEDLVNQIKNKPDNFLSKVVKGRSFWKTNDNDNMKFKAIVGNPPYQEVDGGAGSSALPIYNHFVTIATKISPSYISMIMPARWYAGGRGLDEFRDFMLNDKHIKEIHDFPIGTDCFNNVEIKGGICYLLWEKGKVQTECKVCTHAKGIITSQSIRPLLEEGCDIFIRQNEAIEVLRKVQSQHEPSIFPLISSLKPFGLRTYIQGDKVYKEGYLTLYANGAEGFIAPSLVTTNLDLIPTHKVFISRAYGAGEGYPHQILNKPFYGKPGSCCTETYLCIGPFLTKSQADNFISYIKSKFFRFMVMLIKNTQDAPARVYRFVPLQDFTASSDIDWSKSVAEIDQQLYAKYSLTPEEISFIESMIKPM